MRFPALLMGMILWMVALPLHAQENDNPNVAAVTQFIESLNNRVLNTSELNAKVTYNTGRREYAGVEAITQYWDGFFAAFADTTITLDEVLADGHLVVADITITGVHEGVWMDFTPTNYAVQYQATLFFQMADGKILNIWEVSDIAALAAQLRTPDVTASSDQVPELSRSMLISPCGQQSIGTFGEYQYKPGAPFRDQLADESTPGTRLVISGLIMDVGCDPIADATIEIWQANADGSYDFSEDYLLRGQITTDEEGYYEFSTIYPGSYQELPPHINLKISPNGGSPITVTLFLDARGSQYVNLNNNISLTSGSDDALYGEFNLIY